MDKTSVNAVLDQKTGLTISVSLSCPRILPGVSPTLTCPSKRSLPSEIFGVIAEFLAGDNALLTLANVNILNHDIHQETLPVLYETVWATGEYMHNEHYRALRISTGFRYTK
jgi:hypothetical protein